MVCKLFLYTFIDKSFAWFFRLTAGSITSWKQFENVFLTQFGDNKTSGVLLLEISQINFNKKEKDKDFNQRFINLLNQILDNPTKSIQIEFYTIALPPSATMFIKGKENTTLGEYLLEAIKVEKDLAAISSHQGNEESKVSL